jgi:hypothetical protein
MSRPRPTHLWAFALTVVVAVAACSGAGSASSQTTAASPAPVSAVPASPTGLDPAPSPTLLLPTLLPTPEPTPTPIATGIWSLDLYNAKAVRMQNPDITACTAASAVMMLNMATYWTDYASVVPGQPDARRPTSWKVDTSYARMETLLAYQRKTGTMLLSWPGADTHGWRNALNYYGWGDIGANVYHDVASPTFERAAIATVRAIALFRKPVGILVSAGNHAQIVTGYKVTGEDPRAGGTAFTIIGVYVTDPLSSHGFRDHYVSLATWKSGGKTIRFDTYQMTNSPYVDKIDGKQGNAEWDGKWVVVVPVA